MTFKKNIGNDVMITSEFGEYFLGYHLVKQGLFVARVNIKGCDLFVIDKQGKVFKGRKDNNKMIGIEVKIRKLKSPSITWSGEKIKSSSNVWNFDSYLALISKDEILMAPKNICRLARAKTKEGSVSFSKLKKAKENKRFKEKIIYLKWQRPVELEKLEKKAEKEKKLFAKYLRKLDKKYKKSEIEIPVLVGNFSFDFNSEKSYFQKIFPKFGLKNIVIKK